VRYLASHVRPISLSEYMRTVFPNDHRSHYFQNGRQVLWNGGKSSEMDWNGGKSSGMEAKPSGMEAMQLVYLVTLVNTLYNVSFAEVMGIDVGVAAIEVKGSHTGIRNCCRSSLISYSTVDQHKMGHSPGFPITLREKMRG
jgi:hypothetical protein